jgi:1-phosphofructokinase family hexose kinase
VQRDSPGRNAGPHRPVRVRGVGVSARWAVAADSGGTDIKAGLVSSEGELVAARLIVTVTLNLALDVTYRVRELVPESSVRVDTVEERAGGKGVNVARVLNALAVPAAVTGFVGGGTGDVVRADLAASGLDDRLVEGNGETRRTVAIVDARGRVTILLEPGPVIGSDAWDRFLERFDAIATGAGVVVLSGSLPRGLPADAYARLVSRGRALGCGVILDASGEPFVRALGARPAIVKPNRDELYEATGGGAPGPGVPTDLDDVVARGERLRASGPDAVVVSLGPDGLVALVSGRAWHAALPAGTTVAGNPTGAGDAAVAALARGLAAGDPWPDRIRDAVALSAAAVLHPLAGGFNPGAFARMRDQVQVREIDRAPGH